MFCQDLFPLPYDTTILWEDNLVFIGRLQINTTGCPSQHMVSDDNDLRPVIYIHQRILMSQQNELVASFSYRLHMGKLICKCII